MSFGKFQIQKQIVAIAITLALPWIGVPLNVFSQTETYPNLPQPKFQDIAPTPSAETGEGGGTGSFGAQSGSVDAGGVVGGVVSDIGNAVTDAANNSPAGFITGPAVLGVGPGPSGTTAGNAQMGVAAFSNVTTGLMTALGFSIAVTGLIALGLFAIAVAIGMMSSRGSLSPGDNDIAADAEHGDTSDAIDADAAAAYDAAASVADGGSRGGSNFGEGPGNTTAADADAAANAAADAAAAAAADAAAAAAAADAAAAASQGTASSAGDCFRAGTFVATEKVGEKLEYRKIEDLKVADTILGVAFDKSKNPTLKGTKVLEVLHHAKNNHPFAELATADGMKFEGTINHRIIVTYKNGAVQIKNIKTNFPVVAFSFAPLWNRVSGIRLLPPEPAVPVFNIVTETQNYLISQDGLNWLLVHNGGGGGK